MLYKHFTEKLLGLKGLNITNIEENEKSIIIYAEMERKEHTCICCGTATNTVHDYREQKIKDIPAFGKLVSIVLRKRRYRCKCCGKRFFECNSFLPKYHRMTNRLSAFVIDKLRDERSFTSVAREVNLSASTVIRIFDTVSYPKAELSEALSIDEFKGNTWGEKYQCILTDPVNKRVLDILPERYKPYLTSCFKQYPKEVRNGVTYFVSDMWRTYADICDVWFKNATQVIDKYHWIRQAIWAFEITLPYCSYAVAVSVNNMPRSLSAEKLCEVASKYCICEIADDYNDAFVKAREKSHNLPIFVFGSLYLVADIRKFLLSQ